MPPPLYIGTPLWHADHDECPQRYPALRATRTADVVIVGGGFTGAAVAWRFVDAGVRVAVLEAERIGSGSTSASTALLMQEPDNDLKSLSRRYGRKKAIRIWELSREATRECIDTLTRLGIRCDLVQRDSVYFALEPTGAAALRREHRSRSLAGFRGRWLDPAALRREAGIAGTGAIRVRGNAQLDPTRACRGFIAAAADRGAMVFEQSRVLRIRPSADHVTVSTAAGTIRAGCVIIATGYLTPRFRPKAGRVRLLHTYIAASRPMTARERRRLGLGRVMVWDTNRPYHYARWTDDDRLLVGGGDRPYRTERSRRRNFRASIESLRAYFVARFPALGEVPIEFAWEGLFGMTPDALPHIGPHRRYPRHLFALGYGGNGMTLGFLAGRLLLDAYRGADTSDLDLFGFSRDR